MKNCSWTEEYKSVEGRVRARDAFLTTCPNTLMQLVKADLELKRHQSHDQQIPIHTSLEARPSYVADTLSINSGNGRSAVRIGPSQELPQDINILKHSYPSGHYSTYVKSEQRESKRAVEGSWAEEKAQRPSSNPGTVRFDEAVDNLLGLSVLVTLYEQENLKYSLSNGLLPASIVGRQGQVARYTCRLRSASTAANENINSKPR